MSGYLLDTNVISKFAPDKPSPPDELVAWMRTQGAVEALFLSAMTITEIEKGIRMLQRCGSLERATRLRIWLDGILSFFDDRILSMDIAVALIVGEMEDAITGKGRNPGLGDIIIAATAKTFGLTVITENIRHFEYMDVTVELPKSSS